VDQNEAYERIRRHRYLRHWSDAEGAFCLQARMTADDGARVLAGLAPHRERIFTEARAAGRREPSEAYAADALVAMASVEAGEGTGSPRATVQVRVDHSALVRGHTERGEVCEIPGVGPIPVAAARRLASDSIITAVVSEGSDVTAVAHLGRTIPARVRTALEARDPTCVVPRCGIRRGLEIDHRVPFAEGGPTTLSNLARLCSWHHYQKTHRGYRLGGGPGTWTWEGPDPPGG
jgi:5-methylcytosine-specific restriction endonuclease McrA